MSIDISLLKRLACGEVTRHLEIGYDQKDIIIESSLMKPLEQVISFSLLKERGVNKIYKLEPVPMSTSQYLIYIISSDSASARTVTDHIRLDNMNNVNRKRWVLFYPGRNIVTDYIFETEGIMGDVSVDELAIHFIPLERQVLSMEYSLAFKHLYIDSTHLPLFSVARALLNFQSLYGVIPAVYTIGEYSSKLINMWVRTMITSLPSVNDVKPEIGNLIIIDRNIDPITVCSSQTTFEGLLSEVFSIKSGYIEVKNPAKEGNVMFLLNDNEPIYNEIRNYQLSKVFPVLQDNINKIQDTQTKGKKLESVSEMKSFVTTEMKKFQQQRQNLGIYLNCAEEIIERKKNEHFNRRLEIEDCLRSCIVSDDINKYIEWSILSQKSALDCLRLLCLWNSTKFSLIDKQKKYFIDMFLKFYGYHHLKTFYNLERSGFFSSFLYDPKLTFKNMLEDFSLIPKQDEQPNRNEDLSDVFEHKYRPLSSVIVEKIISNSYGKVDMNKYYKMGIKYNIFSDLKDISTEARSSFAVFYLGGVCHSEISCLRILAKKYNKNIIVMTTSVLNGNDIMSMHIE